MALCEIDTKLGGRAHSVIEDRVVNVDAPHGVVAVRTEPVVHVLDPQDRQPGLGREPAPQLLGVLDIGAGALRDQNQTSSFHSSLRSGQ